MKRVLSHLFTGIVGGVIAFILVLYFYKPTHSDNVFDGGGAIPGSSFGKAANFSSKADSLNNVFSIGFGDAADKSLKPVVHIRSIVVSEHRDEEYFGDGFWENSQPGQVQESSGSGVIISSDGYIVTNNHVVDEAKEIAISLFNRRVYKAEIIGTDPSTDLALLKIKVSGLPVARLANSDEARVGDWVLAVGNPFNLASTVTAGIISAKARNIHILSDNSAVESFIQTDAAVNPGNSGGALVNLKGELIGINTAIATPTGTFAGYSFAVPSNIVRKVVKDLKEFGEVQRGYLGVVIRDLDWTISQGMGLDISEGVIVDKLLNNGAAKKAGIEKGDVITEIDNRIIRTTTELIEVVASHAPGEEISVSLNRDGKQKKIKVRLQRESRFSLE
jgi:serine protease Do